jgi:hypothetical protein
MNGPSTLAVMMATSQDSKKHETVTGETPFMPTTNTNRMKVKGIIRG